MAGDPQLVTVGFPFYKESLDCCGSFGCIAVALLGGFWSAPLVPVTEVEKLKEEVERAYVEGYDDAGGSGYNMTIHWKNSRAKRVVEGRE